MKLPEIKIQIQKYSSKQLRTLVLELYKALPKKVRDAHQIDELLKNPDSKTAGKITANNKTRPLNEIEAETLQFVEYARAQYYGIPNRYVSKSERPKWRFIARRLYKEISFAAKESQNSERAAQLLEELYNLLCDACDSYLFNAYDPFESVGISQVEFFTCVLELNMATLSKQDFLTKALSTLVETGVNRYTLESDLMRSLLSFLRTPDLKYLAIEKADQMLRDVLKTTPQINRGSRDFRYDDKVNNLCEFVFRCYLELRELDSGLEYFEKHYRERSQEVKLYILITMLFEYKESERIAEIISDAQKKGIKPRNELNKLKLFINQHHKLPEYMD